MELKDEILKRFTEVRNAVIAAREEDHELNTSLYNNNNEVDVEIDFPKENVKISFPINVGN